MKKILKNIFFLVLFLIIFLSWSFLVLEGDLSKFVFITSFVLLLSFEYFLTYLNNLNSVKNLNAALLFQTTFTSYHIFMYVFAIQTIFVILFYNKFTLLLFYLDISFIISKDTTNYIYKNYLCKLI